MRKSGMRCMVSMDLHLIDGFLEYEFGLLKNPDDISLWQKYIGACSSFEHQIMVTVRAINHFIASKSYASARPFYIQYLGLMTQKSENLNYYDHRKAFSTVNTIFSRCLGYFPGDLEIWLLYLQFLNRQASVKFILNEYIRCFRAIEFENHSKIWPLMLEFTRKLNDPSLKTDILLNHISFGAYTIHDMVEIAQLNQQKGVEKVKQILLEKLFSLDDWKLILEYISDESIVEYFYLLFPEEFQYYYLKMAQIAPENKKAHYYNKALAECRTVYDFTAIYEAYLTHLESSIDSSDYILDQFENLLGSRQILINNIYLKSDPQNIDYWFKKFDIYRESSDLNNLIKSYVGALTTINPLTYTSQTHKLYEIWVQYAKVYSDKGDLATANLIYSKAVKSKFKELSELVEIYKNWLQIYLDNNQIPKALEILEEILFKREPVSKSVDLWLFYFEILEINMDDINTILKAYNKMIELKYASPEVIFQMVQFLEEEGQVKEVYRLLSTSLEVFGDPQVQFEVYNQYLMKLIKYKEPVELIRDMFDRSLIKLPENLQAPIRILYSEFEFKNGLIIKSLNLLDEYICSTKTDPIDLIEIVAAKYDQVDLRRYLEKYMQLELAPESGTKLLKVFIQFETTKAQWDRVRYLYEYMVENYGTGHQEWENFELEHGNEETFKKMIRAREKFKDSKPGMKQWFVKGAGPLENPDVIDIDM